MGGDTTASSDQVRRTTAGLTFAGVDITGDAAGDLISLTYTGTESETDDLQLQLQDRDGKWLTKWLAASVDNIGLQISASLTTQNFDGLGGTATLTTGVMELDAPGASGPPGVVTIAATSLGYASALRKSKKDKAWCNYTLQKIAAEIAGNGGLELVYESSYNPEYERTEQSNESDIEFLEELCDEAGISLKVTDGQLVLYDQATYEAKATIRTLARGDQTYEAWDLSTGEAETAYTSVRVRYANPLTGEVYDATYVADEDADSDDETANRLTVNYLLVSSQSEAETLAEKLARLHNKSSRTATFTVPGDTTAVAGVTWQLEGWGLWSGKYIITTATHTLDSNGYTTSVQLRACQSG